jgi:hypothetical protein
MTSGQSIKCERNDTNPVNPNTDKAICHQKVDNIFHQRQGKGISWTDWEESMPGHEANPTGGGSIGSVWFASRARRSPTPSTSSTALVDLGQPKPSSGASHE